MTTHSNADHLTDEQIIELLLLGGELASKGTENDLPCDQCTSRVQQLQQQWQQVQGAINEVNLPPGFRYPVMPRRPQSRISRRGWLPATEPWRIAAGICLLVAAGAVSATTPVGVWVAEWLDRRLGGGQEVVAPAVPQPSPERQRSRGARISFSVNGPEMEVELMHRQPAGRIILYPEREPRAWIEVAGGAGTEIPLVREGGVQIRNSSSSGADYHVGVPPSVVRVRIRAGGGPTRLISRHQITDGMELGPGASDMPPGGAPRGRVQP